MALHRIKGICDLLRSCLVDGRKMLFMVEQVSLPMREVCPMHNADTQYTVGGERGGQRADR